MPTISRTGAKALRLWQVGITSATILAATGYLVSSLLPGGAAGVLGEKFTASSKADFALSLSPASRSVTKGTAAAYTVTMTPGNGYKGTVALSASVQLGSGATASFSPVALDSKTSTSTMTVSTANASIGTWSVTVTGSDGSTSHNATASLVVQTQPAAQKFALAVTPGTAQVLPGDVAQYNISLTRNAGYADPIQLGVSGLPSGASVSLSPVSPVVGNATTLQVTTSSSTPNGTYTLQVTASGPNASTQTTTTQIVVTDKGKSFSISGSPTDPLFMGAPGTPIDLVLSNSNNQLLNVTNLTVTVIGTSAGDACAASNFAVKQFSGGYPISLGRNQSVRLSALQFAPGSWPSLQLVDDAARNQDACKKVTVYLAFSGLGQG